VFARPEELTMLASVVALVLVASAPEDPPAREGPPTQKELAAITERGRDLAGYDAACWHASDAVQAKGPRPGSVVRYIGRKTPKGWVVAFGKLDARRDKFLVAYEATEADRPDRFEIEAFDPPKEDTGFSLAAARAIDTALKDFRGERRAYNVASLPADDSHLWVYVVPAPTRPGVWPLGGDVRYRISPDGGKIVEKRQMHKAIIEKEAPAAADPKKAAAGLHTHVLGDVPEDSDVFHVLGRKPSVPEVVRTGRFVFGIGPGGEIEFLGKVEEVFKK
jgi:hypothetical protein